MNNILAIVAHPDDLEMMAGASVVKWISEGKHVHVVVLTNGSWVGPDGNLCRPIEEILKEKDAVHKYVGYDTYEILNEPTLELQFKDSLVCDVLRRIKEYNIDTILTSWNEDSHRDHRMAYEIALQVSRHVPNFLMGQINYYMTDFYTPNLYVDITTQLNSKLQIMALYKSQWRRSKEDWTEYLTAQSVYYGKVVGVKYAEGFIAKKMIL